MKYSALPPCLYSVGKNSALWQQNQLFFFAKRQRGDKLARVRMPPLKNQFINIMAAFLRGTMDS